MNRTSQETSPAPPSHGEAAGAPSARGALPSLHSAKAGAPLSVSSRPVYRAAAGVGRNASLLKNSLPFEEASASTCRSVLWCPSGCLSKIPHFSFLPFEVFPFILTLSKTRPFS